MAKSIGSGCHATTTDTDLLQSISTVNLYVSEHRAVAARTHLHKDNEKTGQIESVHPCYLNHS